MKHVPLDTIRQRDNNITAMFKRTPSEHAEPQDLNTAITVHGKKNTTLQCHNQISEDTYVATELLTCGPAKFPIFCERCLMLHSVCYEAIQPALKE